jgi:hypothetical protein
LFEGPCTQPVKPDRLGACYLHSQHLPFVLFFIVILFLLFLAVVTTMQADRNLIDPPGVGGVSYRQFGKTKTTSGVEYA